MCMASNAYANQIVDCYTNMLDDPDFENREFRMRLTVCPCNGVLAVGYSLEFLGSGVALFDLGYITTLVVGVVGGGGWVRLEFQRAAT